MAAADDSEGAYGQLGRLFAALVQTDGEKGAPTEADAARAEAARDGDAATSVLDVEALCADLLSSPDPMALLARFVADVRTREGAAGTEGHESVLAPSAFERHLAGRLADAGLGGRRGVRMPSLHVARPHTSGLLYLRVDERELSWAAKVGLLRAEAALNAALLASRLLPEANDASAAELVRAEQRVCRSVVAQAERVRAEVAGVARGEWAVREALSYGIEAFQLPYRLTARFRVNARAGAAALELDLVPPSVWAATAFVDGLGVVPATAEMRRRAATDYNLRLVLLAAAYALGVAPELSEVWVAGVVDTPTAHACYCCARIMRAHLDGVDLSGHLDPLAVLRRCGALIESDGCGLVPVRQFFSLDDELFCPARRHDPVELSESALAGEAASALGCERVCDLGIDEARRRRRAADELVRHLGTSTAANVRALLDAAEADGTEDVREAAGRCVRALVAGELEDDPLAIAEAFVGGDDLSRAVERARDELLAHDAASAERTVAAALAPLDEAGAFADTDAVAWRSFGSYVDRVLHNRLLAAPGAACRLVPEPYLEAHLLSATAALAQGRADEALAHARRAAEVAPLCLPASLQLASCLEATGDADAAEAELCRLLSVAHDPETLGLGYLHLSQLQWQRGQVLAAQACYQRARRHLDLAPALAAGLTIVAVIGQVGAGGSTVDLALDPEQADRVLEDAGIPLAPTQEVADAFFEATRASVDAELFGVARSFLRCACAMTRSDVYFGILRSLEDEPDR